MTHEMKKNPHAKALGKIGGKARAAILSPERIKEIARKAGIASGKARASRRDVNGLWRKKSK